MLKDLRVQRLVQCLNSIERVLQQTSCLPYQNQMNALILSS